MNGPGRSRRFLVIRRVALFALVFALALGFAYARSGYVLPFEQYYSPTTVTGYSSNSCLACHFLASPSSLTPGGNAFYVAMFAACPPGQSYPQCVFPLIDDLDSDGDLIPNQTELLTVRGDPPTPNTGYNPGLIDCPDGRKGYDPLRRLLMSNVAETPPGGMVWTRETSANCGDGLDNDCDAFTDLGDADCCTSSAQCSDGNFCNGAESCVGGACADGSPPSCNDGISCTVDRCNSATDACLNTPTDANCDDGLYCNGSETCSGSGCLSGTQPCAAPLVCDENDDTCVECLVDGDCDDDLFCNGFESCLAGACQAGSAPDCSDGVDCTVDGCSPETDACENVAANETCDDGLFCTGTETCDPVNDCQPATDPCVAPLTCDEALDRCVNCLGDQDCDDGLPCNGQESCSAGVCLAGQPVVCDDGVPCTVDLCNAATGACTNEPDDGGCDDGQFCNGAETCDATNGCRPAAAPCVDPQVCDEAGDRCVECLIDGQCDDGLFCNGVESCQDGACAAGTPETCEDGVACTVDRCDATTDVCVNAPDDATCDDGQFCNGAERCDPQDGCNPGSEACPVMCDESRDVCFECAGDEQCDDGDPCTSDACLERQCTNVPDDLDQDTIADCADNCIGTANPGQADFDGDDAGDACETGLAIVDADGSGRVDGFDLARLARAFASSCCNPALCSCTPAACDPRYDPAVDFSRDCSIDGNDLALLGPGFSQTVPSK